MTPPIDVNGKFLDEYEYKIINVRLIVNQVMRFYSILTI